MPMVKRSRFDSLLAENSGAEIRSESRVIEMRYFEDSVEAVTSGRKVYRGRYGVLAAGALSPFDEFFDTREGKKPTVAIAGIISAV